MRELTISETEDTAGGVAPLAAIAYGIAAAYAYEKAGGAKGIEKKVKAAIDLLVEGAGNHAKVCNKAPAACMPVG